MTHPRKEVSANKYKSEEVEMVIRKSEVVILPLSRGNARGGKDPG